MASTMDGLEKFWKHWRAVEEYRQWHTAAYKKSLQFTTSSRSTWVGYSQENNFPMNDYTNATPSSLVSHDHDRGSNKYCEKYNRVKKHKRRRGSLKGYDSGSSSDSDSDLSLTFEVNEDMIAFFEKSMMHKIELRKNRLLQQGRDIKNVTLEELGLEEDGSTLPYRRRDCRDDNKSEKSTDVRKVNAKEKTLFKVPTITSDEKKKMDDMTHLYGYAAPKICGMETAIQLSFERLCDVRKPVYWPCIPFRP